MASTNGTIPDPTALKVAKGNPGKRPEDVDLTREVQPDEKIPDCPDYLDQEGKKQWEKMTGYLVRNKLCTEVDGEALAVFCQAWSRMVKAEKELALETLVVTGGTGGPIKNPLIGVITTQAEIVTRLCQQFGMTPAARAKIKFPPGTFEPKKNKWKDFASGAVRRGGKAA